jgi:hypothetical protein
VLPESCGQAIHPFLACNAPGSEEARVVLGRIPGSRAIGLRYFLTMSIFSHEAILAARKTPVLKKIDMPCPPSVAAPG